MREEKAVLVATCSNIRLEKREGMLPIAHRQSKYFVHTLWVYPRDRRLCDY